MLKRLFSRSTRSERADRVPPATLPKDLARKVRRIEISTNRLVDQGFAGRYHSVFKGRGMEFAEVRPYQPGDEIRSIDWNVTARMDQPFVKRLVEERDLTVFLAIDVSGSLGFGSHSILKRELAAEIAALLAFAAQRNRDRVGAALISDRVHLFPRLRAAAAVTRCAWCVTSWRPVPTRTGIRAVAAIATVGAIGALGASERIWTVLSAPSCRRSSSGRFSS